MGSYWQLLLNSPKLKRLTRNARWRDSLILIPLCLALAPSAYASSDAFLLCAHQYHDNDTERLKCYDQVKIQTPDSFQEDNPVVNPTNALPVIVAAPILVRSYLTRAWNLDDKNSPDESRLGRLQPYRQNYLSLTKTNNINNQPSTPSHVASASNDYSAQEMKFQLSFKADIGSQRNINLLGFKTFRMWGAYTQQSSWQIFNSQNSSPFRITNYEPELIATVGTNYASALKLLNLGLVHQSNGQGKLESRNWNRVYVQGGWEWNDTTSILARRWWRIPENSLSDDNTDIVDYYGKADLVVRWEPGNKSQSIAMLIRNNLRKTANRGFIQIDWALPVNAGASSRLHLQFTSGYGENLIDYNHKQTTLGLGFSFREW